MHGSIVREWERLKKWDTSCSHSQIQLTHLIKSVLKHLAHDSITGDSCKMHEIACVFPLIYSWYKPHVFVAFGTCCPVLTKSCRNGKNVFCNSFAVAMASIAGELIKHFFSPGLLLRRLPVAQWREQIRRVNVKFPNQIERTCSYTERKRECGVACLLFIQILWSQNNIIYHSFIGWINIALHEIGKEFARGISQAVQNINGGKFECWLRGKKLQYCKWVFSLGASNTCSNNLQNFNWNFVSNSTDTYALTHFRHWLRCTSLCTLRPNFRFRNSVFALHFKLLVSISIPFIHSYRRPCCVTVTLRPLTRRIASSIDGLLFIISY